MAHALSMRATSLAASTAFFALAAMGALSLKYTIEILEFPPQPTPVDVIDLPPAPSPTPRRSIPRQLPTEVPAPPIDALSPPDDAFVDAKATSGLMAGPTLIENPHWLQRPRNLARYYPLRAAARGVEGYAELDCRVSTQGALACVVLTETPAGFAFGAAALRIAHDHTMVPATHDGAPVQGRYRMRVPFELD